MSATTAQATWCARRARQDERGESDDAEGGAEPLHGPMLGHALVPGSMQGLDNEHVFVHHDEQMFARLLLVTLVAVTAWALFARDSGAGGQARSYRVQAGDTLWSIAASSYGGDPREGVWKLRERNHLAGTTIAPGQVLRLP